MTDTTNTDAAAADLNSLELAVFIARVIDEKQGENTIVLPVGPVVGITEYFIVTSASNPRLVRADQDEGAGHPDLRTHAAAGGDDGQVRGHPFARRPGR